MALARTPCTAAARARRRLLQASLAAVGIAAPGLAGAESSAEAWAVVGDSGRVRHVIVPMPQATDQAAYQQQIARLCPADETCFLNFYTNSTGAAAALPLPDAIAQEATATFRRSMKNGVQLFTWSCRLKLATRPCF